MKNNLKLSLFIHCDSLVTVTPCYTQLGEEYICHCDPTKITLVEVQTHDTPAQITKITAAGVDLHDMDRFSTIWQNGKRVSGTNGCLEPNSKYQIKIRYSPKSHHYLTYLIDKFRKRM